MSKKYWPQKDNRRGRAVEILKAFESSGGAGPAVPGQRIIMQFHGLDVEMRLRALAELMKSTWPNGGKISWTVLGKAIDEAKATGTLSLEAVEKKLDSLWAAHAKEEAKEKLPFRVVHAWSALESPLRELPEPLSVFDLTITFCPFVSLDECLHQPLEACPPNMRLLSTGLAPSFYTEVQVNAPTAYSALNTAHPVIDAWRHMYNFGESQRSRQFSFVPTSRAALKEPLWMFSNHDKQWLPQPLKGGPHTTRSFDSLTQLDANEVTAAKDRLESLGWSPSQGSSEFLLRDAHQLFGLALDQELWHQALLVFWQLMEHLTLIDRNQNHYEVCRRLPHLGLCSDRIDRDTIDVALQGLMNVRNMIVHKSELGSATDQDVDFLRLCCITGIQWLHRKREVLPTRKHLLRYFDLVRKDNGELDRTSEVLDLIRAERGTAGE